MNTLRELTVGQSARILRIGGDGALRHHLLDMGLIPGAVVTFVKLAPMGDPMEVRIHDYTLTLRLEEAVKIDVEILTDAELSEQTEETAAPDSEKPLPILEYHTEEHPGLGEGGKFHDRKTEHPLPKGTILTFALAGNQNSGKTTLFNQLTGANQHVGNFPGVTVDRKTGVIRGHKDTEVTDLPGIYSMSPYSSEEIVSRQYILNEKPRGIINIVDATNIERNLYLTLQLLELDIPMVIALNMMDEVQGNGGSVLVNQMEMALGVPVIPISASKNQGVEELIDHAIHVAKYVERPKRLDFCNKNNRGGAVHRAIHGVMALIQDHTERAGIPIRFAATKLLEGDDMVISALGLDQNEKEMLRHITKQMEKESGLDHAAAIADMRFSFIQDVVRKTVIKPKKESREQARSRKIDRILTGKYTAIPMFIAIMGLIFWLTFNVIGAWLQDLMAAGINILSDITAHGMQAIGVSPVIQSLITDGIFNGVGSVLSFLPIIVVLFFFLSLLEDTGYMARVAFLMDKLLRKIGLSGRSMVPMLIGFGCSVPAVMASRTLPSERDRRMTILLIPFMSCSAKVPMYAFFTAAFFPGHGGLVMITIYLIGIFTGILVALLTKNSVFKGEAVPFVMELPNYRMPSPKSVLQLLWEKSKEFITKAFTVIFIATIAIWFLQNFSPRFTMVTDSKDSILAIAAGWITPIFKPLGFSDWRISVSLISGFMAKESVVSTLHILFGSTAALQHTLQPFSAFCLLVFCLLYTPCVAAITSIGKEMKAKTAVFTVFFQCIIAWIAAFLVHALGSLILSL